MKNKNTRIVVEIILALFLVSIGKMVGGVVGDLITVIGGITVAVVVVGIFKKKKEPPHVS